MSTRPVRLHRSESDLNGWPWEAHELASAREVAQSAGWPEAQFVGFVNALAGDPSIDLVFAMSDIVRRTPPTS